MLNDLSIANKDCRAWEYNAESSKGLLKVAIRHREATGINPGHRQGFPVVIERINELNKLCTIPIVAVIADILTPAS